MAVEDHSNTDLYQRYQYGAALGTDFAYYSRKGRGSPANMEVQMMQKFYDFYGALPVANGARPTG